MKKRILFLFLVVLMMAFCCEQLPPELGDPPTTVTIQVR